MKDLDLGVEIEMAQIENGVTVTFFSQYGPSKLDKTVCYESFDEALKAIDQWLHRIFKEET